MVLGDTCTRRCGFCAVKPGRPARPDEGEPARLVAAVGSLGLKYAVVTSVTRDDLPDGGAAHFARCVRALKEAGATVEALIPDFNCDKDALETLLDAKPDVVAHNLETIERLTPEVRDRRAGYRKSLQVLRMLRAGGWKPATKTGIMAGLGETYDEVVRTMADARDAGADIFTIGQYLRPGSANIPVREYVAAEKFAAYGRAGLELGFRHVASGPLVRSSYRASEAFRDTGGLK
jgi:lipoic acid synthetase